MIPAGGQIGVVDDLAPYDTRGSTRSGPAPSPVPTMPRHRSSPCGTRQHQRPATRAILVPPTPTSQRCSDVLGAGTYGWLGEHLASHRFVVIAPTIKPMSTISTAGAESALFEKVLGVRSAPIYVG